MGENNRDYVNIYWVRTYKIKTRRQAVNWLKRYFENKFENMALVGTWKRVKVDNGEAFGKAIGATEEQLKASAVAVSTVTYTFNGNNVQVDRCHTIGEKQIVSLFNFKNT